MILEVSQVRTEVHGKTSEMDKLIESMNVTGEDEDGNAVSFSLMEQNTFYSGLLKRVTDRLRQLSIPTEVKYLYERPESLPLSFQFDPYILPGIKLYPYQCTAARKFLLHGGHGLLEAGTGAGKTEIAIALTKYLGLRTIFFCDRVFTMEQTYERFKSYGLNVGRLGGGHRDLKPTIIVAVVDSLYSGILAHKQHDIADCVANAEFLIVDEAHHGSCKTWMTVLENSNARYRLGMSAASFGVATHVDADDLRLVGLTGDIICKIPPRWLIDNGTCKHCDYTGLIKEHICSGCGEKFRGYLAEPLVFIHNPRSPAVKSWQWGEVYQRGIVDCVQRNQDIVSFASQFEAMGKKILVIVDRHKHGFNLVKMLNRSDVVFSYGGGQVYHKSGNKFVSSYWTPAEVRAFFNKKPSGILIGSSIFDEGVDLPSMNVVFLAGGGKSHRRTIQRIGRTTHNRYDDYVYVVDFRDNHHVFLRKHSILRAQTYSRLQYPVFSGLEAFNTRIGGSLTL